MNKLSRADLLSLEEYARVRPGFRARVMAHKRNRRVPLGPHAALYFEDRLTMQYQVQEMLRAERLFEADEIEAELAAYNPLIPDGCNLKATFMLEYDDAAERGAALARLIGIEDRVWLQVKGRPLVRAIADEDLERENAEKTSAIHFLRFELTPAMAQAFKAGTPVAMGVDHSAYTHRDDTLSEAVRSALAADLD